MRFFLSHSLMSINVARVCLILGNKTIQLYNIIPINNKINQAWSCTCNSIFHSLICTEWAWSLPLQFLRTGQTISLLPSRKVRRWSWCSPLCCSMTQHSCPAHRQEITREVSSDEEDSYLWLGRGSSWWCSGEPEIQVFPLNFRRKNPSIITVFISFLKIK